MIALVLYQGLWIEMPMLEKGRNKDIYKDLYAGEDT